MRWHRRIAILGVGALAVVGARAPAVAGASTRAACAAGDAHVAVVVDFGSAPGAPNGVLGSCVDVPGSANGMTALRAADQVGVDSSGKVCQIAGFPATYDPTNCSAPQNGQLSYWAYFHGMPDGWTYSSIGAGGWRVQPSVVEGWHFVTVAVTQQSSAPPPRNFDNGASYLWQSTCADSNGQPPSTASPTPPPAFSGTSPGSQPGAGAGASSTGGSPSASTSMPAAGSSASPTSQVGPASSEVVTGRADGSETTGLRSGRSAARLSRAQVAAAAKVASGRTRGVPISRMLGAGLAIASIAAILVYLTRRSRHRAATGSIDQD
ncbi:MAG: hypothetical protein JST73_11820 [Actinobacteria bacterium]|nr:hypothetical protein [Actinomycetota bacterium]